MGKAINKVIKSVSLDVEVFKALEKERAGRTWFLSGFVNDLLKEKLGLEKVKK